MCLPRELSLLPVIAMATLAMLFRIPASSAEENDRSDRIRFAVSLAAESVDEEPEGESRLDPLGRWKSELVLMIGDDIGLACDIQKAMFGNCLVHLLTPHREHISAFRQRVHKANLGGKVVVALFPADGHLPHPDRFVNAVFIDRDTLGTGIVDSKEIRRVVTQHGAIIHNGKRLELKAEATSVPTDQRLDGWFSHWYDASGNCVSQDEIAGFPRAVQWQHGPAMEDGTADGKIPRIAHGRALFLDNLSGDLICRNAGNGLLQWRKHVGLTQNSALSIAGRHVHLWYAPDKEANGRDRGRETGFLAALDLTSGKVVQTYKQGLEAGTAEAIEVPWAGRTRKLAPVPWFIVNDKYIVQAYGSELVILDRVSGKRLWNRKTDGATWFSPIISAGVVVAAEATYPAQRKRNNGSDFVRAVSAFAVASGDRLWRNERIHPQREFQDKNKNSFVSRASFKTMSAADGMLLLHVSSYQFKEGGSIAVLDLKSGRQLWRREFDAKQLYTQGSQRPVIRDGEVVVLDGTGAYRFDARTGEPISDPYQRPKRLKRSGRRNGACTGSRATVNWLMANAWLYVGPDGKPQINQAARGACGQGVVPANGLVYVAPTPCDCGDYLRGYLALAPKHPGQSIADQDRIEKGPAWGKVHDLEFATSEDVWPVFLGNQQRTSFTTQPLPERLKPRWSKQVVKLTSSSIDADRRNSERYLGALSAPVVAGGVVLVAAPETHEIMAVSAATGDELWRIPTGGKVDSPPTIAGELAAFGCDDGTVSAVRLRDGELVWRFQAAPTDGVSMLHGHLASTHPVPGSVLVLDKTVIAVAGQHTDLGGLHVWALDLATGNAKAHRRLDSSGIPSIANNITVADSDGHGFWIVSLPGGSYGGGGYFHLSADLKDIPVNASTERPAMIFDRQGTRVRFRTGRGRGGSTHGWKGAMRGGNFYRLRGHRVAIAGDTGYALEDPSYRSKSVLLATGPERDAVPKWQLSWSDLDRVESLGALIATGDKIVIGGGKRDGSAGILFILDADRGKVQQRIALPSRITECGLAFAAGQVVATTEDGVVHYLGK